MHRKAQMDGIRRDGNSALTSHDLWRTCLTCHTSLTHFHLSTVIDIVCIFASSVNVE